MAKEIAIEEPGSKRETEQCRTGFFEGTLEGILALQ